MTTALRTTDEPIATSARKRPLSRAALLKRLTYETIDGRPIFYRGYKDVLNGTKTIEEIMGDSSLQAWLKSRIGHVLLNQLLDKGYDVTVGEQGLHLAHKRNRSADIAIFRPENLVLDKKYSKLPPEVVIEIDIDADLEDEENMAYIHAKIADYFRFGIQKVIWVLSETEEVIVATRKQPPYTVTWADDVEVLDGAVFNLHQLLANRRK